MTVGRWQLGIQQDGASCDVTLPDFAWPCLTLPAAGAAAAGALCPGWPTVRSRFQATGPCGRRPQGVQEVRATETVSAEETPSDCQTAAAPLLFPVSHLRVAAQLLFSCCTKQQTYC
jgi:hypothetical protein